jgi:hypothetical protein
MRQYRLGLLIGVSALAALSSAGCGIISFDIDQDIPPSIIYGDPNNTAILAAGGTPQPLVLDIQAETQARHTGPASSAHLKSLSFTITDPSMPPDNTFKFATEVHIYLIPQNPSSSLSTIEIANLKPVPPNTRIDMIPIPGVDILPYANEGADITASASGYFPSVDTTYVGHVTVTVKI